MAADQSWLCFLSVVCVGLLVSTDISFAAIINNHFENVAFNKVSTQSSTYLGNAIYVASKAVDGNINSRSHTDRNDNNPHWEVDLGRPYPVYRLRSHYSGQHPRRMRNIVVTVDGNVCYRYPDDYYQNGQYDFTCATGIKNGTKVRLFKPYSANDDVFNDDMYITLAEFMVFSCKDSYWGPECNGNCGHCKSARACDKVTGSCDQCDPGYALGPNNRCTEACPDGWYGTNCSDSCSVNCNGVCHKVDGYCSCKPGYRGYLCDQMCPDGTYGAYCRYNCGVNCQGGVCDKANGYCTCKPGYRGDLCIETCPDGWYGTNCSDSCSVNCYGVCHKVDGYCSCKPGYRGYLCDQMCPDGTYGAYCRYNCSVNCQGGVCDKANGYCTCKPGYRGDLCIEKCADGTYGVGCSDVCGSCAGSAACDHVNGYCPGCSGYFAPPLCKECVDNVWGINCDRNCSQHCTNVCDKSSGACTCALGYQPPTCLQVCHDGYYGNQCTSRCGNCSFGDPCRHDNGQCQGGCQPSFAPPLCQGALLARVDDGGSGDSGIALGAGVGAAAVVIAAGVAVAIFIVIRRRRRSKEGEQRMTDTNLTSPENANFSGVVSESIYQNVSPAEQRQLNNSSTEVSAKNGHSHVTNKTKPKLPVKPNVHKATNQMAATGSESFYVNVAMANDSGPSASDVPDNEESNEEAGLNDVYYNDDTYMTSEGAELALDSVQKALLDKLRASSLNAEFEKLETGLTRDCKAGEDKANYYKNRFTSILPYDDNRVVLSNPPHPEANDYINASFVRGWNSEKAYIAAQGPRNNTTEDMWWMMWQEQVTHIVMLTLTKERDKKKSEEYWPGPGKRKNYGDISVTNLEEQARADYVTRTFQVQEKTSGICRRVVQFHYVAWPDHGIPKVTSLVDFRCTFSVSHRTSGSSAPLLVHCSAGVGRTGTYIALDSLMEQADHNSDLDLYATATRLRHDRCFMIQTKSQYRLLHEAVLEAYTCRKCRVSTTSLGTILASEVDPAKPNDYIDTEFKKLQQMKVLLNKPSYNEAQNPDNINKNRDPTCLPDDSHVVYLTYHIKGRNQYINAVYTQTFFNRRGCILTQLPLQNTIIDFWRLVAGNDVTTIFSLGAESETDDKYWPREKDKTLKFGPFSITLTSQDALGPFLTSYTLTFAAEGPFIEFVQYRPRISLKDQSTAIKLHYYSGWGKELPDHDADLVQLLCLLTDSDSTNATSAPVILQCRDGACRSGMTRVMADVLSRMAADGQVDVYTAVKQVQPIRPQTVASPVHYRYVYHMLQHYIESNNTYQNV